MIRSLDSTRDVPAVAALLTAESTAPVTAEGLLSEIRRFPQDGTQARLVAVDDGGRPVGYASLLRTPWDARPSVSVLVDRAHRGRGIGSALFAALQCGETPVACEVSDQDPVALRFAQRRGFQIDRQRYTSAIDPTTFDETPFRGVIESVKAGGLRFFSFAEERSGEHERKLYELYALTAPDIPGNDSPGMEPFEEFRRSLFEHPLARLDCIIVAAEGNRFAGVCTTTFEEGQRSMFTWYTAVAPAYRGRHIALALKLLAIRAVGRYGVTRLATSNDSQNAPMLAVNRRLGYIREPGVYALVRGGCQ